MYLNEVRILLTTLYLLTISYSFGQLSVKNNIDLETVVKAVVGNNGLISNISKSNNTNQISHGYFQNGQSFGLNSGLLLTSGNALNALPPNSQRDKGSKIYGSSSSGLYDKQYIEFDIIPASNELKFKYVFGSEEYDEYVDDLYNDKFEISIIGNEFGSWYNFATVPNSGLPVSVGTINSKKNSNLYNPNEVSSEIMEYDGYTNALTAKVNVSPCKKYKIRFLIADQRDSYYDSGVFIEGKIESNNINPFYTIEYENNRFDSIIEQCNNAKINIIRPSNLSINNDLNIYMTYSGTADLNSDYTTSSINQIKIPKGQNQSEITINAITDNYPERLETIQIDLSLCPNTETNFSTITIPIIDQFETDIKNLSICKGQSIEINPNYPFSKDIITWTNDKLSCTSCTSPIFNQDTSTWLNYSVRDPISNCLSSDSVYVFVLPHKANFSSQIADCYTAQEREFKNSSDYANEYKWYVNDELKSEERSPILTFGNWDFGDTTSKMYTVKLITKHKQTGCTDSIKKQIIVPQNIFIPNVFTPNRDGANDSFKISGVSGNCWTFKVMNRWGKVVYQTKNYQNDWDGDDLAAGVYYFYIFNDNKDREFKGYLQLIR